MLENCVSYEQSPRLAFRLHRFLLAVVVLQSTLVIRLFGLRLVARSLLFARFLFASTAFLLGPLSITIAPFTVVRFVFAAPLPIFILGLV